VSCLPSGIRARYPPNAATRLSAIVRTPSHISSQRSRIKGKAMA